MKWGRAFIFLIFIFIPACRWASPVIIPSPIFVQYTPTVLPPARTELPTITSQPILPVSAVKEIGVSVPGALRKQVDGLSLPGGAKLTLDISAPGDPIKPNATQIQWMYVLVAPFPTIRDGVTLDELRAAWSEPPFNGPPLLMAESTLGALKAILGEPVSGSVRSVDEAQLLDSAWNESAFAIIPFESLSPRWKVLTIDGQSPIQKGFDASLYPLVVSFNLQTSSDLQPSTFNIVPSNYDASKLTTVILTGTTALVRATAFKMEQKGITNPGEEVRDLLRGADIMHMSNEVSFFSDCPTPDPNSLRLVFCSDPKYIDLLKDVGVDVVELTGNHFADYGRFPMEETIDIYKSNHISYFGGGSNIDEAMQPALFEVNGNKIAFIGCNMPDVDTPEIATADHPGSAPCAMDYFAGKVAELKAQGYIVIFTFQWGEDYVPEPSSEQMAGFRQIADAGAAIVSGSQAHFPKTMELYGDSFIHYGLGNLFFDQMGNFDWMPDGIRNEFIDRYVIYNGRLIGVELFTTLLEDFSRPRFMTEPERANFLNNYFSASGWTPITAGTSFP